MSNIRVSNQNFVTVLLCYIQFVIIQLSLYLLLSKYLVICDSVSVCLLENIIYMHSCGRGSDRSLFPSHTLSCKSLVNNVSVMPEESSIFLLCQIFTKSKKAPNMYVKDRKKVTENISLRDRKYLTPVSSFGFSSCSEATLLHAHTLDTILLLTSS